MTALRTTICCSAALLLLAIPGDVAPAAERPTALRSGPATSESLSPAPRLTFPLASVWEVALGGVPAGPPAFDADQGYIPLRSGQLVAVSLSDGLVRWSIRLSSVLALSAGDGLAFAAADMAVTALAKSDGSVRWRAPIGAAVSAPLLWDTGWLFAGTDGGDVVALRATDGAVLWRRPLGSRMRAPAAPAGDRVYVSLEDGRVVTLALAGGAVIWERPLKGPPVEILALDDRLFVGSKDNFFYCLAANTGKVKWRWRTGADIVGAAALDESRVYFASLDNLLRALDRGSGVLKWQHALSIRPSSGPLLIGDALIVSGVSAELHAYRSADGTPAGDFTAAAELAAPPHLARVAAGESNLLVILTLDGRLEALGHKAEPVSSGRAGTRE